MKKLSVNDIIKQYSKLINYIIYIHHKTHVFILFIKENP